MLRSCRARRFLTHLLQPSNAVADASQFAGKPKVLVTGAAGGSQGKTGYWLTRHLLDRGVPVRALVRKDDDRAAALRAAGAEVGAFDRCKLGNML